MAKLTYPVLSTLVHDDKTYVPGKTVLLDEEVGEPLVANGTLGEGKVAKPEKTDPAKGDPAKTDAPKT